eukprot:gene7249-360_t
MRFVRLACLLLMLRPHGLSQDGGRGGVLALDAGDLPRHAMAKSSCALKVSVQVPPEVSSWGLALTLVNNGSLAPSLAWDQHVCCVAASDGGGIMNEAGVRAIVTAYKGDAGLLPIPGKRCNAELSRSLHTDRVGSGPVFPLGGLHSTHQLPDWATFYCFTTGRLHSVDDVLPVHEALNEVNTLQALADLLFSTAENLAMPPCQLPVLLRLSDSCGLHRKVHTEVRQVGLIELSEVRQVGLTELNEVHEVGLTELSEVRQVGLTELSEVHQVGLTELSEVRPIDHYEGSPARTLQSTDLSVPADQPTDPTTDSPPSKNPPTPISQPPPPPPKKIFQSSPPPHSRDIVFDPSTLVAKKTPPSPPPPPPKNPAKDIAFNPPAPAVSKKPPPPKQTFQPPPPLPSRVILFEPPAPTAKKLPPPPSPPPKKSSQPPPPPSRDIIFSPPLPQSSSAPPSPANAPVIAPPAEYEPPEGVQPPSPANAPAMAPPADYEHPGGAQPPSPANTPSFPPPADYEPPDGAQTPSPRMRLRRPSPPPSSPPLAPGASSPEPMLPPARPVTTSGASWNFVTIEIPFELIYEALERIGVDPRVAYDRAALSNGCSFVFTSSVTNSVSYAASLYVSPSVFDFMQSDQGLVSEISIANSRTPCFSVITFTDSRARLLRTADATNLPYLRKGACWSQLASKR